MPYPSQNRQGQVTNHVPQKKKQVEERQQMAALAPAEPKSRIKPKKQAGLVPVEQVPQVPDVRLGKKPDDRPFRDVNPLRVTGDRMKEWAEDTIKRQYGADSVDDVSEKTLLEGDPSLIRNNDIKSKSKFTTDALTEAQIQAEEDGRPAERVKLESKNPARSQQLLDELTARKGKLYNQGMRIEGGKQYQGAPSVMNYVNSGVYDSESIQRGYKAALKAKQTVGSIFQRTLELTDNFESKDPTSRVSKGKLVGNKLLQEAQRRMNHEAKTHGAFGEWRKDKSFESGADIIDWIAVVGNRFDRYSELTMKSLKGELRVEDEKERNQLEEYMKKQRNSKKKNSDNYTDIDLATEMLKLYATSQYSEFGKATDTLTPVISTKIMIENINNDIETLVKSMDEKKETTMQELAKSLDEMLKSYDELAKAYEESNKAYSEINKAYDVLSKSLDVLAKDRDDIVDVLEYFDGRFDELEKSAKNFEAWMPSTKKAPEKEDKEDEEDEKEEVKKMAEGVPTKTLATGENNAPVMKGKQNDIDQKEKVTEVIPIPSDVKAPKALSDGKSGFDPKSMIDEGPKLSKSFTEGVKVGEMNAIKKVADEGLETPHPSASVEQTRDLAPLSKSDMDLVNMSFGKIERMYRSGKLIK